jgi:hypothetical protein
MAKVPKGFSSWEQLTEALERRKQIRWG